MASLLRRTNFKTEEALKSMEGQKLFSWPEDRKKIIQLGYAFALLGASDEGLANALGVSTTTIQFWKREDPEFALQLNAGKSLANAEVASSFFRSCTGYDYEEEHAFVYRGEIKTVTLRKHRHGDPWAQLKWLGIKEKENWAEAVRHDVIQNNINIANLDLTNLSIEELQIINRIQEKNAHVLTGGHDK